MALSLDIPSGGRPSAPQTFVFSDVHTDYTAGIFVDFARRMAARGHRILFLHPPPATSRELIDRFQSLGAETHAVPALTGKSPWGVAKGIENAIVAESALDPILVACESVPMRGQALLAIRRHWRTVFHVLLLRTGNDLRTYLRERIDASLVRRSGGVVLGCSRGVCEHMTERMAIDAEKVAYFPNWTDHTRFAPNSADRASAADANSTRPLPTICCVAAFRPVKQQDLLIRAIARLRAEGMDFRVLMVGAADRSIHEGYFRQCQDLAARLALSDRISFLGSRQDVPDLLRQCDAFVLPSRQEGLACALLEAMASALPSVAAAIHASYEVIVHGMNGFLFAPGSELDLAATIRHVLALSNRERHQVGAAARRTVAERYVWEAAFRGVAPFLGRHGIHV